MAKFRTRSSFRWLRKMQAISVNCIRALHRRQKMLVFGISSSTLDRVTFVRSPSFFRCAVSPIFSKTWVVRADNGGNFRLTVLRNNSQVSVTPGKSSISTPPATVAWFVHSKACALLARKRVRRSEHTKTSHAHGQRPLFLVLVSNYHDR